MSGLLERVLAAATRVRMDLTADDIADAVWLAQYLPADPTARMHAPPDSADSNEEPDEPDLSNRLGQDTATERASRQGRIPTADGEDRAPRIAELYALSPEAERLRGGRVVWAPAPAALSRGLEVVRALRPLIRQIPSSTRLEIDVDGTVARIAEELVWEPVLRGIPDRWLDLTLVADVSASMAPWQESLAELRKLLERLGGFSRISLWSWNADEGRPDLHPSAQSRPGRTADHNPRELIQAGGRHLILVLTDCVSSAWHTGKAAEILDCWAKSGPVALVQLLPESLWPRTGLRNALPLRMVAGAPAAANAKLTTRPLSAAWDFLENPEDDQRFVSVPVMTLEPHSLRRWARMLTGAGDAWAPGFRFRIGKQPRDVRTVTTSTPDAAEIVRRFLQVATTPARKLSRFLAAAPCVSLPVMRIIRTKLLPNEAGQAHDAEVLLGGLLRTTLPADDRSNPERDVLYEFRSGIREILIGELPRPDIRRALDSLSEFIEDHIGLARGRFRTILASPNELTEKELTGLTPFARILRDTLNRVSDDFKEIFGRRIQPSRSSFRVRVAGSVPTNSTEQAFVLACRQIGEELARRGHVPVICSANESTADYQVFLGFLRANCDGRVVFARQNDRRAGEYAVRLEKEIAERLDSDREATLAELARVLADSFDRDWLVGFLARLAAVLGSPDQVAIQDKPSFADAILSALQMAERTGRVRDLIEGACRARPDNVQLKELQNRYFRDGVSLDRQIAEEQLSWSDDFELGVLNSCDGAILVGGKTRTHSIWQLSAKAIPYLVVPSFGGIAATVWPECARALLDSKVDRSTVDRLFRQWEESRASLVVDVFEQIASRPARKVFDHVLWVDDRPNNNTLERRRFEAAGLRFTLALTTQEALAELDHVRFSTIISDMGRREGPREGYALLDAVRSRKDQTPLVFYAASNDPKHKAEAMQHGGQGSTNNMAELTDLVIRNVFARNQEATPNSSQTPLPARLDELTHFLEEARDSSLPHVGITLSPLLQIKRQIQVDDPPLQFGPWVTTRQRHTLGSTPPFRLGIYQVRNLDFFQFVAFGGYEDDANWMPDASRTSLLCRDGKSPGPRTWSSANKLAAGSELHPVSGVSFYEADAFCRWMNQVAPVPNWKWQLPTEDMWEYAARCRGGKTPTRYPWGDNFDSKRCNCVEQRLNGTAEVGTFYSGNTSDGCADMAGNVWEFVALSQEREVARLRGGSFVNNAEEIRSDLRLWGVPLPYGAHDFGFRCALVQATT